MRQCLGLARKTLQMPCVIFSSNCTFISLLFHIVPAITKGFITSQKQLSYSLLRSVPRPVLSAPLSQLFPHRDHHQHFGAPIFSGGAGGGWQSLCDTLPPAAYCMTCKLILWPNLAVIWFKCFMTVNSTDFKRVRLISKSDWWLRQVGLSVRPSAWNNSASTGRISMKFYILTIFRKSVHKVHVSLAFRHRASSI